VFALRTPSTSNITVVIFDKSYSIILFYLFILSECKDIQKKRFHQENPPSLCEEIPFFISRHVKGTFHVEKKTLLFRLSSIASPSLLHRLSIVSPSFRWTIDGLSMDYRWIILGGTSELLCTLNSLCMYQKSLALKYRKRQASLDDL
jgi:hypothetical protein